MQKMDSRQHHDNRVQGCASSVGPNINRVRIRTEGLRPEQEAEARISTFENSLPSGKASTKRLQAGSSRTNENAPERA